MTNDAAPLNRYYIDWDDDTECLVMDGNHEFPVATCYCDMDSAVSQRDAADDARERARQIAAALNEAKFDWQPPL